MLRLIFDLIQSDQPIDEALSGVWIEIGRQDPGGLGQVPSGDCSMKSFSECAEFEEVLVLNLDRLLNPVDQNTRW